MKYVLIKDIQEDTFDELECKLPVLPPGNGYFECKNPHMLMSWKYRFISLFGSKGKLYLDEVDYIEDNEKYSNYER